MCCHSESLENYFERVVKNKFSCYSESNIYIPDVGVGTPTYFLLHKLIDYEVKLPR